MTRRRCSFAALVGFEEAFGHEHPDTKMARAMLAVCHKKAADAAASAAVTAANAFDRVRGVDASASAAVTTANAFDRIRGVDAAVTGAVSIAAVAAFIARMSASASAAITATNLFNRIRGDSASASVAATGAASYLAGCC